MKVSDKVLAPLAAKATIWTNEILHSTASNKIYLWSAFKQFRKSHTGLLLFWCFGRGCVGVLSTQSASSAANMQGPPPALSFSACLWDLLCPCVPANWCCSFLVFPVWLKSSSLTRTTYLSLELTSSFWNTHLSNSPGCSPSYDPSSPPVSIILGIAK